MENVNNGGLIGVVGKKPAKIALRAVSAKMMVNRNVCHTTLQQHYVNTENVAIEAVYSFPLPMDATVTAMQIIDAERILEGVIKGRDAAFDEYDSALGNDLSSYLLDQDSPNHFTCSVGNLAPGQDIVVSISYVQFLCPHDNIYRLRLPLLIAELYTPQRVLGKMDPSELDRLYPPRSLAKLPYGLELNAQIVLPGGVKSIDSPSHTLKTVVDGDQVKLSFSQHQVQMDRDFVVNIEAALPQENIAYLCPDSFAGGWVGYAEFMPNLPQSERKQLNMIFVIDCSGSMQGDSIEDAKSSLLLLLASMQKGDKFNIIAFGSSYRSLSKNLLEYNDTNLKLGRGWVQKLSADMGGTEILNPLRHAVQIAEGSSQNIILLTDGEVGNNQEIRRYFEHLDQCPRIYSIGLGHGADEELLRSLAEISGGGSEMVYPGENLEPVVARHFTRMNGMELDELSVDWGGELEAHSTLNTALIPGTPVIYMKHFDAPPSGSQVSLHVVTRGGEALSLGQQDLGHPTSEFIGLPQLYAKYVLGTQNKIKRGSQQPERAAAKKLEDIAITYQILSSHTSFVVTDPRKKEKLRGGIELRRVPVNMGYSGPASMSVKMPKTVSGSVCSFLLCDVDLINERESIDNERCDIFERIPMNQHRNLRVMEKTHKPGNYDLIAQLIICQAASGYWEDGELLDLLDCNKSQYPNLLTQFQTDKKRSYNDAVKLAITILAVKYIKTRNNKPQYEAMLAKAEKWLQEQGIDSDDF